MGDAGITRDQFVASKRLIRKVAQGKVALGGGNYGSTYIADADFNEAGQLSDYRLTELANFLVAGQKVRFGAGWGMNGSTNQVVIAAGKAMIAINSDQHYLLALTAQTTVSGFTTPSGGTRIDLIYVDVSFPIFDSVDDVTLINPDIGLETAVDVRLSFTIEKLQGTINGGVPTLPTPPAGHYYVTIAQISRSDGVATINNVDITNQLTQWVPLQAIVLDSWSQAAPVGANNNEVADWDQEANVLATGQTASATYYKKYRLGTRKTSSFNTVVLWAEIRMKTGSSSTPNLRFTVGSFAAVTWLDSSQSWHWIEKKVRVDSAADGADLTAYLELQTPGSNSTDTYYVRKIVVLGTLE